MFIRKLRSSDVDFAVGQVAREGWDANADSFQVHLAHDPDGGFIAEHQHRPVGLVTTTRYRDHAWIGNLIVIPEQRRRGIARQLMTTAMDLVREQGLVTIRLEADPPGVNLYRQLGFVDEFESRRFRRPAQDAAPADAPPFGIRELGDIADFDRHHFGDDRGKLLSLLFVRARAAVWSRGPAGIRGYALAVPSRLGVRIGPIVASDPGVAEELLNAVVAECADHTLTVGVPSPNAAAAELLCRAGFQPLEPCRRMRFGHPAALGSPTHLYAIAGGAVG